MKTLLIGFKPYASHTSNPTEEVINRFSRPNVKGVVLNVTYEDALKVREIVEAEKPDCVITMNLSPFRSKPALEEYAYNDMNSIQPDEAGVIKSGEPILEDGPKSLNSILDIPSMQRYVSSCGSELAISIDPGRFVCNVVSYLVRLSGIPSISMHLPLDKDFPIEEDIEVIEHLIDFVESGR